MGTVRTIHLQQWAGTVDSRNKLGELIRQLTYAGLSNHSVRQRQFLANEANQLAGWDGILDCASEGSWIPDGKSVWELGSGLNARSKVKSDFSKRNKDTKLPKGWYKKDTTYVAVSLEKFDDRVDLEKELSREGRAWKAIRVVDAAVFEEWIENYLGVETWLQEQGVGASRNIISLRRFWSDWSGATIPPVREELALCNRQDAITNLQSLLQDENCIAKIKSDSPEESIAFLFAAMSSLGDDESKNLISKSIVIQNPADAASVVHLPQHIVCLSGEASSKAPELSRHGHKVICSFGRSSLARRVDIELDRPLRREFSEALEKMGVAGELAETEARACGSSASIWRVWNQLDNGGPDQDLPEWVGSDHSDVVVPAVLAGGWSESNDEDKKQIELISGLAYDDFRDKLQKYLTFDNPLMQKVGEAWVVSAPATAFAITINGVTTSHLERLRTVISDVFTEVDPTIDLPPDERMYSGLKTEGLSHSPWLRDGLAESVLRIAVLGKRLEENSVIPNGQSGQQFADAAITELIGLSEDWRLITSIGAQLPVLAEAAPVPFMTALDRLLQGQPDSISPIFEEGDSFSGHSLHTQILWALEALAWEPEYLQRVALILARMAEKDPGGSLTNRPINSLKEIFMAWHPGTSASLEERLSAVDLILAKVPEIGWDLIVALMPSGHGVSHNTNHPIWKDFSRSDRPVLTRGDVWRTYKEYFNKALKAAEGHATRLTVLLDSYENVAEDGQKLLRDAISRLLNDELSADDKRLIWEKLRHVVARHSKFPDAKWSLSSERIGELAELQKAFDPEDPIDNNVWLFDEHLPDLPSPRTDYGKAKTEIGRLRVDAILEVMEGRGEDGLIELVRRVRYPGIVGGTVPEVLQEIDEVLPIVSSTIDGDQGEQIFCQSLSGQMYAVHGDLWRARVLEYVIRDHTDSEIIVRPFLLFSVDNAFMDFLVEVGPDFERAFWSQCATWNIDRDIGTLTRAIRNFIANDRAMDVLMLVGHELKELDKEIGYEVLEAVLAESTTGKKPTESGNTSYYIEQIFDWLSEEDHESLERLAKLEYAYLPLLHMKHGDSTLVLHCYLSTDPKFFVSVLCDLYRPESKQEAREPTDEAVSRATRAWEMLHSWNYPPGLRQDKSVDADALIEWVKIARREAKKEDRATLAEQHIGHVLYHLPSDGNDNQWPIDEARDVVEEIISEEFSRGFQIEQFNSRGVTSKAMFEGGNQERELEQHWHRNAKALSTKWPKISNLCKETAESWAREASREDERAAKDRLRYQ